MATCRRSQVTLTHPAMRKISQPMTQIFSNCTIEFPARVNLVLRLAATSQPRNSIWQKNGWQKMGAVARLGA